MGCAGGTQDDTSGCVIGCIPNEPYSVVASMNDCQAKCAKDLDLIWYEPSALDAGDFPDQERARCATTCALILGDSDNDGG
jgi:hypothetical protein